MNGRKLTNELIVFTPELDWNPSFLAAVKEGSGRPGSIKVDAARSFRTPFGTYMIIATLSAVGENANTWKFKDYLARRLTAAGLETSIADVFAPARPKSFRAE